MAGGLIDILGGKSLTDQINDLISQRPQYNIAEQYGQNIGYAKNKAFGRNPAFRIRDNQIDQDVANQANMGQQFSSSTSNLLGMLSNLNMGRNSAKQTNAAQEAQYQGNAIGDVIGANTAMGEEKDKAWNFNVNQPYQLKLQELVKKRKFNQDLLFKGLDMLGTAAGFALGGPAGGALGGKLASGLAGGGGSDNVQAGWGGDIG